MTVSDLLTRITSRELTEWQEYAKIEPFGEERADIRAAEICMVIANANRGKDQKALSLNDFLLRFGDEPKAEPKSAEEQQTMAERIARTMGAQRVRRPQQAPA
jgi:hypothetical protein